MRKLLLGLFCISSLANAQTNISFLGRLDYQTFNGDGLSNLWGYTDEMGNEYAICGTTNGVSVVDLSDPSNPTQIFYEAGSNTMWREVKTYGDYAYITTEANDGMMIIDLSPLPGSTSLPVTYFNGPSGNQWQTAHSLFIDENGILYLHGTDRGNGGVIFYDLNTSPTNPTEVGEFDNWYVHDSYARGDTLYAGHIIDGFFTIVDVSDKMNPVILGSQNTPHNFTHNTWLSDNGQFLFTTDEVSGAFVTAYDITDPTDIQEVDRIQHDPGTGVIPHNTYYLNGYLFTSYYRSGVTIHDAQYPNMLVEVGNYDTSPMSGDGFNGAWGVYCFFPSGNIIISDMEEGLFVLAPTLQRGCYLNGNVTDASNSQIISGATVEILSQNITETTNTLGDYGSGLLTPGSYNIRYSKPGYYPDTLFNVALSTNVITTENVALTPLPSFSFSGRVQDNGTLVGIPNAEVEITDGAFTYTVTTDANGDFTINPFFEGTYELYAGEWGYITFCSTGNNFDSGNPSVTIGLDKGIYDDFTFDNGWTVSGSAPRGIWERGVPVPTLQSGNLINPDTDVTSDCKNTAFVTGNIGGSAGTDDVDSAATILTSPIFDLTGFTNPYINYSRWYVNKTSSGPPNDSLQFYLSNGSTTVRIEFCTVANTTQSEWFDKSLAITPLITPTATMRFIVRAADWQSQGGNLMEGGLDHFYITEGTASVEENKMDNSIHLYPNPNTGDFTINASSNMSHLSIFDMTGRMVHSRNVNGQQINLSLGSQLPAGIYQVLVETTDGKVQTLKMLLGN